MPRKPRFQLVDVPPHVIQRGNNRQACFFAEPDYRYYLDALRDAGEKFGGRVRVYVLTTNHVHLLITPVQKDALSFIMQSVGRRYARYVNKRNMDAVERCGKADSKRALSKPRIICLVVIAILK